MTPKAPGSLSRELTQLVSKTILTLGRVIEAECGRAVFVEVESLRLKMTELRKSGSKVSSSRAETQTFRVLNSCLESLAKQSPENQFRVAHSFALMLELMNACENAYRTHRLKIRVQENDVNSNKLKASLGPIDSIIFVLTAHPTEARSPAFIALIRKVQSNLVRALESDFSRYENELRNDLHLAWRLGLSRNRKPSVTDEANHLYSLALEPSVLRGLAEASREIAPVYLRTWVGGDKDGHPGVNEKVLLRSLQLSRQKVIHLVGQLLREVGASIALIDRAEFSKTQRSIHAALLAVSISVTHLRVVRAGDGARIKVYRKKLRRLSELYFTQMKVQHPSLLTLHELARTFPGLVLPLELRDGADLIRDTVEQNQQTAIRKMLKQLQIVSRGGEIRWYARGLILSMVRDFADIAAAVKLVIQEVKSLRLPVIPLFENAQALQDAPEIIQQMLDDPKIKKALKSEWNHHLEVMLGYSDSSKELGVLQSRLKIARTVHVLDQIIRKAGSVPIFFHGSGGSIDRGGGSVEEQMAWWPDSARSVYKATIQGEMVERTFASPEITRSQLRHLKKASEGQSFGRYRPTAILEKFAEVASQSYHTFKFNSFL